MKLKITDKKLTSLGDTWVFDINGHKWSNNNNECGDNFESYCTGFRAAEQEHQATVDKLMQIIEKYKEASMYISESKSETDLLEAADKMMKELKSV